MQGDFAHKSGTLFCPECIQVIPNIVKLIKDGGYRVIFVSKDWHPEDHCSFEQWPKHCVHDTPGAEIVREIDEALLDTPHRVVIVEVRKGFSSMQEAYSAFKGNVDVKDVCVKFDIESLDICGVAMEYCVKATALDALELLCSDNPDFTVTLRCNSIASVDGGRNSKLISEFMDEFEQKGGKTDS